MKILVVGSSDVVFVHSYIYAFHSAGHDVALLDIEHRDVKSGLVDLIPTYPTRRALGNSPRSSASPLSSIKRLMKSIHIDRWSPILLLYELLEVARKPKESENTIIRNALNEHAPDLIFFFWGTTLRTEKRAIDAFYRESGLNRPHLILDINTYPTRLNVPYGRKNIFAFIDRPYFFGFDKVICNSQIMSDYLLIHDLVKPTQVLVSYDRLAKRYFTNQPRPTSNALSTKRLVFLGNCNFRERTIDDITKLLIGIAEGGVEVWIQTPPYEVDLGPNVKFFEPFSYDQMARGELGRFVAEFDVALVAYSGLNNARSAISYPTRLALALTGLIPVAIKAGEYKAVENVLGNYDGLLMLYEDLADLLTKIGSLRADTFSSMSAVQSGALFLDSILPSLMNSMKAN